MLTHRRLEGVCIDWTLRGSWRFFVLFRGTARFYWKVFARGCINTDVEMRGLNTETNVIRGTDKQRGLSN